MRGGHKQVFGTDGKDFVGRGKGLHRQNRSGGVKKEILAQDAPDNTGRRSERTQSLTRRGP